MTMGIRHSETGDRVTLEVEFDQHHGLVAHDPTIMTRLDRHNLRSLVFHNTAIGVFDVNLAVGEKPDVSVHAEISADNRFHVDRPAKSSWIYHTLDTCCAGTSHIEPDMADRAPLSPLHRREKRVRRLRSAPRRLASFRDQGGLLGALPGGFLSCHVPLFSEQNGRC
jgi:hypothetical protein